MSRSLSVSRTFSAGNGRDTASPGATDAPQHREATRRHSSCSIRALMWGATGQRSLGSPLGSANKPGKDSVFNFVVTPESIPQFTIPNLGRERKEEGEDEPEVKEEQEEEEEEEEGGGWGSPKEEGDPVQRQSSSLSSSASSSSSGCWFPPQFRTARRSSSDIFSKTLPPHPLPRKSSFPCCPFLDVQLFPDPATRAALSLPHLPKVTTPYGFLMLGQSPQVASEEDLFFQVGEAATAGGQRQPWSMEEEFKDIAAPPTSALDLNNNPAPKTQAATRAARRPSLPVVAHLCGKDQGGAKTKASPAPANHKSRFRGLLRKHLASLREMSNTSLQPGKSKQADAPCRKL